MMNYTARISGMLIAFAVAVANAGTAAAEPSDSAALQALLKVGMIGMNAVATVVKPVINSADISRLATAGLVDPVSGIVLFGAKLLGAISQLVPPTTGARLVTQAFDAVVQNITDNSELLNVTTWVRYWDTVQRHGAYSTAAVTATGAGPTGFVADWFAAVAHDLADEFGSGAVPIGGSTKSTTGFFGESSGASTTPNSSGTGQFPFGTGADGTSSGGATSTPPTAVPGTPNNTYPFSEN